MSTETEKPIPRFFVRSLEREAWITFYASAAQRYWPEEAAAEADRMLEEYRKRCPEAQ